MQLGSTCESTSLLPRIWWSMCAWRITWLGLGLGLGFGLGLGLGSGLGLGLGYDGLCRVPLAHVARRFVEQAERVVDLVRVRVGLGWQ